MKNMILLAAILCCATVCINAMAAGTPAKTTTIGTPSQTVLQSGSAPKSNIAILSQDSGTNFSKMNKTLALSPNITMAQAVGFKPPKPGWKLELIRVMGSDGWNMSSNVTLMPLPFTIEIRDENWMLLYHYSEIQLPYFTHPGGTSEIKMANIEIPAMTMRGNFFVCFYGYRSIALLAELQNATGNSYYYNRLTGQAIPAVLPTIDNKTIPVNWIIRVAGQ